MDVDETHIATVTAATAGFSGQEIVMLVGRKQQVQALVYGRGKGKLTASLLNSIVEYMLLLITFRVIYKHDAIIFSMKKILRICICIHCKQIPNIMMLS